METGRKAVRAGMMADARELPPWLVGSYVRRRATEMGASRVEVLLQDFDQRVLVPLGDSGQGGTPVRPLAGSMEGQAFSTMRTVEWSTDSGRRLAIPLVAAGERVGVLSADIPSGDLHREWEEFAAQAAALILSKGTATDVYFRIRRRRHMTLAAEIQWHLLPPLGLTDPRLVIAGMVEPAYEMGGDAFDYAINQATAHVGVFDAMGHALRAAVMATVAVGAYRHGRRISTPLPDIYRLMDQAVSGQFGADEFVTAVMAEVDLSTGAMTMVNAGHPAPLHVRGHHVLGVVEGGSTLPVGLGGSDPVPVEVALEPGDRLVLYSDGVTEARQDGLSYGLERLVDDVEKTTRLDLHPAEAARHLSGLLADWRGRDPDDDATIVVAEWRTPELLP